MTISKKIVQYRKKAGLSQEELAQRLSVSRQAVSKWETGESMPEIAKLALMAKLFGVSADFLIDDEQDAYSPPYDEKRAFIDEDTIDRLTVFLRRHFWLSGILLIIIGGMRLVSFMTALASIPFSMALPFFTGNLINFAMVIGGIIIIVKFKPKKKPEQTS